MNILFKLLERPLFIIVSLPYLTTIYQIEDFSNSLFLEGFVITLLIFDSIFHFFLKKKQQSLFYIIFPVFFVVLNTWIFFIDFNSILNFKLRYFIPFLLVSLLLVYSKYIFGLKKNNLLIVWNFFLIFFSFTNFAFSNEKVFYSKELQLSIG